VLRGLQHDAEFKRPEDFKDDLLADVVDDVKEV
jgi:hypothetical protein